jgi:hypothetical protein
MRVIRTSDTASFSSRICAPSLLPDATQPKRGTPQCRGVTTFAFAPLAFFTADPPPPPPAFFLTAFFGQAT